MKIFKSVKEWMDYIDDNPCESLGFVPTMGALHEGHLSLVKEALKNNSKTLVSIYVNPTQFNNQEDLNNYPSSLEQDIKLLEEAGNTYLLLPNYEELYPDKYRYKVTESDFSQQLCGNFRPGHFDGVLTVVMKLINLSTAQNIYFGEKDYQQLQLIKDMAKAFFMKSNIIGVPTKREDNGLAMSSRNLRLSDTAKEKSAMIYALLSNKNMTLDDISNKLTDESFEVEYLEEKYGRRFIAAHIENVRLIDNVSI